ncbi:hypothetical protein FK545_02720 [Planococcus glaciei]|nr:hypothetical protein [Planococcus glaciei]QDY44821.1 hypothetical protein FK545_02720 [Planococcus glaciei]
MPRVHIFKRRENAIYPFRFRQLCDFLDFRCTDVVGFIRIAFGWRTGFLVDDDGVEAPLLAVSTTLTMWRLPPRIKIRFF